MGYNYRIIYNTENSITEQLHQGMLLAGVFGLSVALCTPAVPGISIRKAVLSDRADAEAICAVREPTQYVVEDGAVGFMGQKVELDPEEAFQRRVQARLGTAIRDEATVLIAMEQSATPTAQITVIGTADLIGPLEIGTGRRGMGNPLPRRLLLRNLWVADSFRRRGIARRLMATAMDEARSEGVDILALEVDASNAPALALYRDLGFEELDPMPAMLPGWMRGALLLGKGV